MKLELRQVREEGSPAAPRGLLCIVEDKEESALLDAVFGDKVGTDGLIGIRNCECRLSDGYAEHYIYIHAAPTPGWRALVDAPLDGTEIELLIRNHTYFHELKSGGKDMAEKLWQEIVRAKWIDHNRGGWTWNGIAGSPVGWRPIAS